MHFAPHHHTLLTLHNTLPRPSVPLLCNAPCRKRSSFSITGAGGRSSYGEHLHSNNHAASPTAPSEAAAVALSLTCDGAKLSPLLRHGNYPRNPPRRHRGSPSPPNEPEQLLTSAGWVRGWIRSRSPESSFSHLTVFPPGRHSRSGRLPEARAPSPSRTQVGNDGAMKTQPISHKFSSQRAGWGSISPPLLHAGVGVTGAVEPLGRARTRNLSPFTRRSATRTGVFSLALTTPPALSPLLKQAEQAGNEPLSHRKKSVFFCVNSLRTNLECNSLSPRRTVRTGRRRSSVPSS